MDLDQVSAGKFGAGIGIILVPASSVVSSGEHRSLWRSSQNTDRTDREHVEVQKGPAKQALPLIRPAVAICGLRAINPSPRAMMVVNTDRTNYLQTVILWPGAVDAGGILPDVTPKDHTSNPSRSTDLDHGPSKPP